MATISLKGIWGLEQLDRTGIATWQLTVILIVTGALVGYLLFLLFGQVDPEKLVAHKDPAGLLLGAYVFFSASGGLWIAIALALSRTTQLDFSQISQVDSSMINHLEAIKPTKGQLFLFMVSAIVINSLMMFVSLWSALSFDEALDYFGLVVPGWGCLFYLLMPLAAASIGLAICILRFQAKLLSSFCREIEIDLLRLKEYNVLSNPLARIIILGLSVLCVFPFILLVWSNLIPTSAIVEIAQVMSIAGFLVFLFLISLFTYPLWTFRNRIQGKKNKELQLILQALDGNDEAIKESRIMRRSNSVDSAELLIHRMFVESLWEWPIASHVQKSLLFGLITPMTWVLAAAIENVLY